LTAGPNLQILQQGGTADTKALMDWAYPFIRNLAALLILGLLVAWVAPVQLFGTAGEVREHPWKSLLIGLAMITLGWIVIILAIVIVIAIVLFLYWISLPYLAFLLGMLGLFIVGLAAAVFWLTIVFFSKLVVAELVGSLLFKRFLPRYTQSRVLPLVVGVLLYALLASVPYLGWVVVVLATLFGLGAIWLVAMPRKLPEPEGIPAAAVNPAEETLDASLLPGR
jgi:hypothetical protein